MLISTIVLIIWGIIYLVEKTPLFSWYWLPIMYVIEVMLYVFIWLTIVFIAAWFTEK